MSKDQPAPSVFPQHCDFCGSSQYASNPNCAFPFEVRPHRWTGIHPADQRIAAAMRDLVERQP